MLLENVHEDLPPPTQEGMSYLVQGRYKYYHYGCDSFMDQGWGCGYRTLQTLSSWLSENKQTVPNIPQIQEILVSLGDKPAKFAGSKDWIGSVEVCYVLDHLYDVPSKIVHIRQGTELKQLASMLTDHFTLKGCPIMMGGDRDCSSKGIMGIHVASNDTYLLIVDPHFLGNTQDRFHLHNLGWVKWQNLKDFVDSSFYNLCLPQRLWKNK